MAIQIKIVRNKTVQELEYRNLVMLQDSQDIDHLKEMLGNPDWFDYDFALVEIGEGEYVSIYVGHGLPYLTSWVDTILIIDDTCLKCMQPAKAMLYESDTWEYELVCACGNRWYV